LPYAARDRVRIRPCRNVARVDREREPTPVVVMYPASPFPSTIIMSFSKSSGLYGECSSSVFRNNIPAKSR